MHAYGHQWSCQLVYNPRLREGLGLTDGEGTERLWSRLRQLIGITRTSAVHIFTHPSDHPILTLTFQLSRRLWLIDRQSAFIAGELRDDLGDWILRRLRHGVKGQSNKAREILDKCGIPLPELREQWEMQRKAQTSIRRRACDQ
jgi:hypothetical protein